MGFRTGVKELDWQRELAAAAAIQVLLSGLGRNCNVSTHVIGETCAQTIAKRTQANDVSAAWPLVPPDTRTGNCKGLTYGMMVEKAIDRLRVGWGVHVDDNDHGQWYGCVETIGHSISPTQIGLITRCYD